MCVCVCVCSCDETGESFEGSLDLMPCTPSFFMLNWQSLGMMLYIHVAKGKGYQAVSGEY